MKPVVQLERAGCGIASMAVLAGVSYAQAKHVANRLGIFADDPKLWPETDYVRRLLKEYGFQAARNEVSFASWEALLILHYSRSNGTKKGVARSGIGWCFVEGRTGLSCSIRSERFGVTCGPTSVA